MGREGYRVSFGRVKLREPVRPEEGMLSRPLTVSLEFRMEGRAQDAVQEFHCAFRLRLWFGRIKSLW